MFTKIRANFLTGALVMIPALLTSWILYFIIDKLNMLLLEPIAGIMGKWIPVHNIEVLIKLAIFFLLLAFFVLIGFATRVIILRNIFGFGEKLLYKLPMVSTVYRSIKEISFAFLVQKNSIFQRAALIEYPRRGLYQIGFVVSETKGEVKEKTGGLFLSVFVPTTPNPTSGMLVLVPEKDTVPLDMSVTEAMKMVISGGAVVPKAHYGNSNTGCSASKKEGLQRD